jgi:glycosyltransferase involved in cell wall biosynthesis
MKLCVFPSDPVQEYVKKGEIKERYYNPLNIFDEIHVMNPSADQVDIESINPLGGNARLIVHNIGKSNFATMYGKKFSIIDSVKKIRPDVIRSYNQLTQGWLAATCSKKLNLPYYLSIHADYENEIEKEYKDGGRILRYYNLHITRLLTQRTSISSAHCVTVIHKGLIPYVKKHEAKRIEVVYNRVNLAQFSRNVEAALKMDKPIILNVGNLRKIKNQECLIRALEGIDANLVLIGRGEMRESLKLLAKSLGIEKKVFFIDSVEHSKIQNYYSSALIFAMPLKGSGITIPILEALASGCITVVAEPNRQLNEPYDPIIYYVRNNPQSFHEMFEKIIKNSSKYEQNREIVHSILKSIDQDAMEKKEAEIYLSLVKN